MPREFDMTISPFGFMPTQLEGSIFMSFHAQVGGPTSEQFVLCHLAPGTASHEPLMSTSNRVSNCSEERLGLEPGDRFHFMLLKSS